MVTIDGLPVFRAEIEGDDEGMYCISLVEEPAVLTDFQAFKAQERKERILYAVADEDRHLVRGVVMRADFPIYRRDGRYEYYIIYKADTIRQMAEKYLADNLQNQVNLDHLEGAYVPGVQMVQWYIKDTAAGVAPAGFDDCADGSLFAEFRVEDEAIWADIKAGTYKGFSLEGYFTLTPEDDLDDVTRIVEETRGLFSQLKKILPDMKFSKLRKAFAKALAFRTITTDQGLLSWDGDEDLKVGDEVFVEDEEGNRTAAEDRTYVTTDGTEIVVEGGKVAEIREPQAASTEENFGEVSTDKGTIRWDGDEDLKEGDAVYRLDEDGNRAELEDGAYTTEDGKVITVEDGKVLTITDPAAEVAARRQECKALAQHFAASYDEKYYAIFDAIAAARGDSDFFIEEAGDDFAVISAWNENTWNYDRHYRYGLAVSEDAAVTINGDPVDVKRMWVPLDYVSPFESDEAAVEAKAELAALRKEVEELRRKPAALNAHKAFKASAEKDALTSVLTARKK